MQVYRACFKVIKQSLPAISIYVGVFLIITLMFTYFGNETTSPDFSKAKINIALFNEDQDFGIAAGLGNYLNENTNIINIPDNQESLQDALFFREVEYIVRIPPGFSQSFLSDQNDIKIEKTSVQDSQSRVYLDFLINRYLNIVNLYADNTSSISDSELLSLVKSDLDQQAGVLMKTYGQMPDNKTAAYYTYLAYAMIAVIFLGTTSIMLVFNDADIKRRNLGSPMKSFNMNMQLFLGNLTFAAAVWLIMVVLSFAVSGGAAFDLNNVLLYVNALCFTVVCLSLSFFTANLITSRDAQQAIANVLSLGLCFLGGVFVSQQLLGKTVNLIASFTPTYWYVKAVNDIEQLLVIKQANISPIINSMLIQLGFSAALLTVALAISKQKRVRS